MRCDNSSIIKKIPTLYVLMVAAFIASNVFSYQAKLVNPAFSVWFFAGPSATLMLMFLYLYQNAQYFEYDSSGEVIILRNKGSFLSNFTDYRGTRAEFPKTKLRYYEVKDYLLYKRLTLYVTSQRQRVKKLNFNITFLNNKKQKLVLDSLTKIAEKNKGTTQWT